MGISASRLSDGLLDIGMLLLGRTLSHLEDAHPIDLAFHDIEAVDRCLLGRGVFNDVYACLLRERRGAKSCRIAIKQVKPQLLDGKPTTVQAGIGIDHAEPRLASRNIAASVLDSFIGTTIVPRATAIAIDGQPFLAMTIAPGVSATRHYREDPTIVLDPLFQRRCNDLEVLAYLSGNPDVHSGNILIAVEIQDCRRVDVRVTMIDNDLSFGPNAENPDQMTGVAGTNKKQYRHTGLPAYIDINTASRIKSIDRQMIIFALRRFLTPREIEAFEIRLDRTLEHIDYLRRINRIVFDWSRFISARNEPLDGATFIEGALDFAGVLQGRMGEERYFAPRSVIVRDCLEGRLGGTAELDRLVGHGCSARLRGWAPSAKKYVPPNGIDHR